MIADDQAIALALARRKAASGMLEIVEADHDLPPQAVLAEALLAAHGKIHDLELQLDAAVRRVAVRCAGPRCEGRGVYYPSDGEARCIECAGRQT